MSTFDYIQTFYVNPDTVANATEIMLTSVDLFFKAKPAENANVSGTSKPGINVWICEVENGDPNPNIAVTNSVKSINYDSVNVSNDAQTPTVVGFSNPILVKTGRYYGIVVKYNDPAYDIWTNVQGDRLIGSGGVTNNASPGSQSRFDGFLYKATNSNTFDKFSNKDLKFRVKVAQFVSNTVTVPLVNKDYEFFTIDPSVSGALLGGEWCYQDIANATGTVTVSSSSNTIIGVATNLASYAIENKIVISNGSVRDVLTITNVISNTVVTVDKFPKFTASGIGFKVPPVGVVYFTDYTKKKVYLVDSNASNSTFKFVTGTRIIGERSGASANVVSLDRFQVDNFKPTFLIGNPSTSDYAMVYNIANSSNSMPATSNNLELLKFNNAVRESYILSRSLEVDNINLYGTERKSAVVNVTFNVSVSEANRFSVPYLKTNELDFFFYQNDISNTITATRGGIANYDTEVDRNGLAKSKYISKKISFGEGKYAEDVVVYLAGYRPSGTQIKVYAKLHNAADKDAFDDKAWTPLELKNNTDRFSTEDPKDLWEYTYGLPQYPEISAGLSGNFLTSTGSNSISTTADQSSVLSTGDLIRVYDILTPENNEVFPVSSANSTAITLFKGVSNTNIIGDVGVDKLKYKNVAWNNIANDNVARYVTSSYTEFDTYNTMQIKVVLLSENTHVVPKVEQIQVIGVSA
jgi:hypothetical protein